LDNKAKEHYDNAFWVMRSSNPLTDEGASDILQAQGKIKFFEDIFQTLRDEVK